MKSRQEDPTLSPSAAVDPEASKRAISFEPIPLDEYVKSDVPRRTWAVEGVWAEGTSGVIAGAPKAGKSTLSLELAVSLATRTPFLGLKEFPVRSRAASVTYVQAENSDERVRRDLDLILEARKLGYMEEVLSEDGEEVVGSLFQPTWPGALKSGDWVPDLQVLSHPGMDLMNLEHQVWLMGHAAERDYLFLDPIYLLASANPNDMGDVMRLTQFLSALRDEAHCAVIYTHQLSDKHSTGSSASRMLGSTLLHGWYESALFTKRTTGGLFTIDVDALREMGEERNMKVAGLGVGEWQYSAVAQDAEDAAGREAPRVAEKLSGIERLARLESEEPGLSNDVYAERLACSVSTVKRWRREASDTAAAAS